jgi:hypothetical protein
MAELPPKPAPKTCPACGTENDWVLDEGEWALDAEWWVDEDVPFADTLRCFRQLKEEVHRG